VNEPLLVLHFCYRFRVALSLSSITWFAMKIKGMVTEKTVLPSPRVMALRCIFDKRTSCP